MLVCFTLHIIPVLRDISACSKSLMGIFPLVSNINGIDTKEHSQKDRNTELQLFGQTTFAANTPKDAQTLYTLLCMSVCAQSNV